MKLRVGDKIKIDKDKAGMRKWYSDEIYIIKIIDEHLETVTLDRCLPISGNVIHFHYLKLLKTDRKNKLFKLNEL